MIEFATPRDDDQIGPARTALHETSEQVWAGERFGRKSRLVSEVVMLLHEGNSILDSIPKLLNDYA